MSCRSRAKGDGSTTSRHKLWSSDFAGSIQTRSPPDVAPQASTAGGLGPLGSLQATPRVQSAPVAQLCCSGYPCSDLCETDPFVIFPCVGAQATSLRMPATTATSLAFFCHCHQPCVRVLNNPACRILMRHS